MSIKQTPWSFYAALSFIISISVAVFPANAQVIETADEDDPTQVQYGHVKFSSEVDSFYVIVNRDFTEPSFIQYADIDSLKLEAGVQHLTIIKPYHFDVRFRTEIVADSTRRIGLNLREFRDNQRNKEQSSYPRLVWGGVAMILSDSDTELIINGEPAGIGMTIIEEPGTYEISRKTFDSRLSSTNITISDDARFEVIDFYYRPDQNRARVLSFIPGGSQIYKRQFLKAGAFIGLTAVTGVLALNERSKFQDADSRYYQVGIAYNSETNPQRALELGNRFEELDRERNRYARNRNRLLGGLAAVYTVNIIDGFLRPKSGYREGISFDPYLDFEQGSAAAGISLRGNF